MKLSRRTLLKAPALLAPAMAAPALLPREAVAAAPAKPLWPGARYTHADKARALRRGLRFVHGIATDPKHFAEYGDDLLWFYYNISSCAADRDLKARVFRLGKERAQAWRKANPKVPKDAEAVDLISFASGSFAAEYFGIRDEKMKADVRRAATRFEPKDFLKFDPTKESVPLDIPSDCEKCGSGNPLRSRACERCQKTSTMDDPYDVLTDALITTYTGQRYGVLLGARLADVAQWLPRFRPYRGYEDGNNKDYVSIIYAVTHIIYAFNDYNLNRLKPEWLPHEYQFLRENLRHVITVDDPETMGEFLDTLKSFGLTEADPLIQQGTDFILSRQNADGSWGDAKHGDTYHFYHSTWTAMNGIMDYRYRGERVSFADALKAQQNGTAS